MGNRHQQDIRQALAVLEGRGQQLEALLAQRDMAATYLTQVVGSLMTAGTSLCRRFLELRNEAAAASPNTPPSQLKVTGDDVLDAFVNQFAEVLASYISPNAEAARAALKAQQEAPDGGPRLDVDIEPGPSAAASARLSEESDPTPPVEAPPPGDAPDR